MQKIKKEMEDLNNTLNQLDLTDTYRTPPKMAEYTFFSSIHETFSRIDHMMHHKINFSTFEGIEIHNMLSEHNGIKLDINNRRKFGKFINMWKLNNMLQNNQWDKE